MFQLVIHNGGLSSTRTAYKHHCVLLRNQSVQEVAQTLSLHRGHIDIAKDNITINNTLTGYFDTERIAQLNAQKAQKMGIPVSEVRAAMEAAVPINRIGKPEEYANAVCFLVSEQASYITGTNIPIDGGLLKSL